MAEIKKSHIKPESSGEKAYKIKLLIDEHIKEVESNLKNIGGLSEVEIKELVTS
jgi:hypothetical protein